MPNLEIMDSTYTDYGSVVTNIGLNKIARSVPEEGKRVLVTQIAFGDAEGEEYKPDVNQTELVHERRRGPISKYEVVKETPTQILVKGIIPPQIGYFRIFEVGIFDDEGDLIAIANMPGIPKVPDTSGLGIELKVNLYIQFESDVRERVQIYVVPEAVESLREEFYQHLENVFEMTKEDLEQLLGFEWEEPKVEEPPVEGDCGCCDCDHTAPPLNIVDNSVIDSWF